jgi:hypothetical protein
MLGGEVARFNQLSAPPLWPNGFTALPASAVIEHVKLEAGARPWDRDDTDSRIIQQAEAGTSAIIDSEQDVGGYETFTPSQAPFDPQAWDLECMVAK